MIINICVAISFYKRFTVIRHRQNEATYNILQLTEDTLMIMCKQAAENNIKSAASVFFSFAFFPPMGHEINKRKDIAAGD